MGSRAAGARYGLQESQIVGATYLDYGASSFTTTAGTRFLLGPGTRAAQDTSAIFRLSPITGFITEIHCYMRTVFTQNSIIVQPRVAGVSHDAAGEILTVLANEQGKSVVLATPVAVSRGMRVACETVNASTLGSGGSDPVVMFLIEPEEP